MALHNTNGSGAPATTPTKLGQHYTDTSSGDIYISKGIASAADWVLLQDGAALGTIATQDANAVAITGGTIVDLTEFELPVSAAPTVNSDGEIALDTTVADFSLGVVKFYGGEEQGIVSMPIAQFTAPIDGYVVRYNGTNDEFELAPGGSGSSFGKIVVSGQSDVDADTSSDTLTIAAGANITITTDAGTDTVTIAASGGLSDGDKGDITVSGSGATWTIDNDVVTYAKMQNVSATSRILGRTTAGAGDVEELTGAQAAAILGTNVKSTESFCIACSDETTAITTGTAKVTFRMPYAFTLSAVRASVTTAPTGSTIIIDINEAGSTILSTKLSIDASEKTSTTAASAAVISDTAIADDAEITIDFDQVGSTIAGAGVKVYLIGTRA